MSFISVCRCSKVNKFTSDVELTYNAVCCCIKVNKFSSEVEETYNASLDNVLV